MTDRPGLSKAETEVARILWEKGSASVREIHESLVAQRAIEFKTVQTYLRRLESKGYIRAKLVGRVRIYSPRIKPATVIRETVADLVDRLFGGKMLPLMRHLIEDGDISPGEIEELRAVIARLDLPKGAANSAKPGPTK